MISIGITGTGSLIGQAIIKSIRRSDLNSRVELIGMDYFENTVGSFWCEKNFLLPDLLNEEVTLDQWEQTIVEIIVKNKLRILFVGVDFELIHFSRLKNQIYSQTGCTIFVSDENVISISNDKFLTYKFLKEGEIPYPASFLKIEDISGVQFPLIIKPRIGARSRGVYKVDSFEELKKRFNELESPVIQEYIGNENEEFTCGIIFLNNRVHHTIALKRSLKQGNTAVAEYSEKDNKLLEPYLFEVAEKLKPEGACNFQLRIDSNRIPKIFEINARHSGTTYMRSLFGFLEIEYMIKYILGESLPKFELRPGKAYRYYEEKYILN